MISKTLLEELKQKNIRICLKNVVESQCSHTGKIVRVTEYVVILHNEEHNADTIIPIDTIAFIRIL